MILYCITGWKLLDIYNNVKKTNMDVVFYTARPILSRRGFPDYCSILRSAPPSPLFPVHVIARCTAVQLNQTPLNNSQCVILSRLKSQTKHYFKNYFINTVVYLEMCCKKGGGGALNINKTKLQPHWKKESIVRLKQCYHIKLK